MSDKMMVCDNGHEFLKKDVVVFSRQSMFGSENVIRRACPVCNTFDISEKPEPFQILKPGKKIDPQILKFTCPRCACEFQETELKCDIEDFIVHEPGGSATMLAYRASHDCPNENCGGRCQTDYMRKYSEE